MMLHIVREILVEIRQRVRIRAEGLVLASQSITRGKLAEAFQIDHIQRTIAMKESIQIQDNVTWNMEEMATKPYLMW